MNNCLVTTLKAATGNTSLLKVGEMVIDVKEMSSPTSSTNSLILNNSGISDFVLEVENGEANLTLDSNMSSGWSSKLVIPKQNAEQYVYFRNGNYRVRLTSKYNIISYDANLEKTAIGVDVKYLQFSNNITKLIGLLNGDIAKLATNTSLKTIICEKTSNLSGDIASIKNLTKLESFKLVGAITGDIASLKNLTLLSSVTIENSEVSGDIASLENIRLNTFIFDKNPNITGNIASLANIMNLTTSKVISITQCSGITGDIASLTNLTSLTNVSFSGSPNISGNISSLAKLTSLNNFDFYTTQIRGDVIDLVIAQRSNGRTSGKIQFEGNGIVTFNSKVLSGISTISWTDSTITNETTSETVNR